MNYRRKFKRNVRFNSKKSKIRQKWLRYVINSYLGQKTCLSFLQGYYNCCNSSMISWIRFYCLGVFRIPPDISPRAPCIPSEISPRIHPTVIYRKFIQDSGRNFFWYSFRIYSLVYSKFFLQGSFTGFNFRNSCWFFFKDCSWNSFRFFSRVSISGFLQGFSRDSMWDSYYQDSPWVSFRIFFQISFKGFSSDSSRIHSREFAQ